jgi:hypothetical protein
MFESAGDHTHLPIKTFVLVAAVSDSVRRDRRAEHPRKTQFRSSRRAALAGSRSARIGATRLPVCGGRSSPIQSIPTTATTLTSDR